MNTQDHKELIRKDLSEIYQKTDETDINTPLFLTLDRAIERGLQLNLDQQVATLEILAEKTDMSLDKLKALPQINARYAYRGRSNVGASSSRSVLSGQQSLEPSQSTDQNRRTAELELNWNMIDIALAMSDAKVSQQEINIAKSRYKKIIQNIERDILIAYINAGLYQSAKADFRTLQSDIDVQIENLNMARAQRLLSDDRVAPQISDLENKKRQLMDAMQSMEVAVIELKTLLSIPFDQDIVVDTKIPEAMDFDYHHVNNSSIIAMEEEALFSRPEMEEEIFKKNIAWQETRREILETVPTLEFFLSKNYDSNSFLQDSNWSSYNAIIGQSITSLLTLPARYKAAQKNEFLTDARRRALALATMAQVRLAKIRLDYAYNDVIAMRREKMRSDKSIDKQMVKFDEGFLSKNALVNARLSSFITQSDYNQAKIAYFDSYVALLNTIGRSFVTNEERMRHS